ncbi:hypothetical protein LJC20_02550 [Eubacteriales bacterium OttesenSCG-928-M02]|nr:hypothetical protein [Eubacteriales bacterium OttesenSCG-928-M02]
MATIQRIMIRTPEGVQVLLDAQLVEGWGIAGDEKGGPGSRQVAFSDVDAGREGGLCGPRYTPTLEICGLDFSQMKEGDRLRIGDVALVITIRGKECFAGCPILEEEKRVCYLKTHCGFAMVEQGGEIKAGDVVRHQPVMP